MRPLAHGSSVFVDLDKPGGSPYRGATVDLTKVQENSSFCKPTLLAVAAAATLTCALPTGATPRTTGTDSTVQQPAQDIGHALVQLEGEPLSTYVKTKPPRGKKIDFDQSTVKSYRAQLSALRNAFKVWLRINVPNASVTGEFDIALNAVAVKLGGASLAQVSAAPMVRYAEYQGLYYPTAADPDLAIIKAVQAWGAGGAAGAGAGVRVAIVDSGIDNGHPCFSDIGYPVVARLGPPQLTNNKVIVAKVFNNKSPSRRYTPEAIDSHGTHVAGTVACNFETPTVVDGVTLPYRMSGVAPRALLGNYNVFPSDVGDARSEDIVNALEAAYEDGFDVANMSLGGGTSVALDTAVLNASQTAAKVKFALAAGNDGGDANLHSPARVNGPQIYTIAAFNAENEAWASFSNYNTPPVDYAEPGVNVLSTWKSGGYNTISGTSMATPHMAGLLLLGSVIDGGSVTRTGASDSYVIGKH